MNIFNFDLTQNQSEIYLGHIVVADEGWPHKVLVTIFSILNIQIYSLLTEHYHQQEFTRITMSPKPL